MVQLTPPRLITFLVSFVLAAVAVASLYVRVPFAGHFVVGHRIWVVVAADVLLALGVVSRSL